MDVIVKLNMDDYHKCSNIWDMEKCPFTDMFYDEIKQGNRIVFIYKSKDDFIAEGALVWNKEGYTIPGKRIYLSRLIVKKEYRNQGIGTKLLDYLIKQSAEWGCSEIVLGVDCDNESAIHLYKKKDFEVYEHGRDEYGEFYKMIKELRC